MSTLIKWYPREDDVLFNLDVYEGPLLTIIRLDWREQIILQNHNYKINKRFIA